MVESKNPPAKASSWVGFSKAPMDWVLIAGIVGAIPLLWEQSGNLWAKPHFQYFPIAWIGFAYLLISRGILADTTSRSRYVLGLAFVSLSLIGFTIAVLRFSPWQAHLSLILLCSGWAFVRLGGTPWTAIVAWSAILGSTLPLPFDLDESLVRNLQSTASTSAGKLLDLLSVPHLLKGNVLEIEKGTLFVDEACSGIDSLYALICATLLLLVFQKRSFVQSMFVLLLIPIWGWGGNVTRITLIAYLYQVWDINWVSGWQHTAIGLAVFAFVFASVIASLNVIVGLTKTLPNTKEWLNKTFNAIVRWPKLVADSTANAQKSDLEPLSKLRRYVLAGIALTWMGLGIVSIGPFLGVGPWKARDMGQKPDRGRVESTLSLASLPSPFETIVFSDFGFSFREGNHFMGEFSATWKGLDGDKPIMVSLDFPFAGHHPLEECYVLTGSTIVNTKYVEEKSGKGTDYFREAELVDQYEQPSYVVYTLFEADGQSLRENSRLMDKLFPSPPASQIYQLQIYTPNQPYPGEQKREEYRQWILKLKEILLPKILEIKDSQG